jgi:hypothetical protein
VVLAATHRNHDMADNADRNLAALFTENSVFGYTSGVVRTCLNGDAA